MFKPTDCRCDFPRVIYNDIIGHASFCPSFRRARACLVIGNDKPAPRETPTERPRLRLVSG